jgi:3-isopropylmalate/(R)-2-methylmalate dehydratase small subunit
MQPFTRHCGLVALLDRANVDTDAIIPKQFIKSIRKSGFGPFLFDEWRYLDRGELGMDCSRRPLNPDFELNQPRYRGTSILLTRENFGCGSSREHAAWALADYGFHALIAPSFGDIFRGNCYKNGMLPIVLPADVVDDLFAAVRSTPGYELVIDLPAQTVSTPSGGALSFAIDEFHKTNLVNGLDDIALTLAKSDRIRAYEARRRELEPWLFTPTVAPRIPVTPK